MMTRYHDNPYEGHWTAVKNILKYLRNTKEMFLVFRGQNELNVSGLVVLTEEPKDHGKSMHNRVPYASFIGSVKYAMTCTHHDISYALTMVN